MMDLFSFPPEFKRPSDFTREIGFLLKGEFHIETRRFDLLVENTIEIDVHSDDRKTPKVLYVRLQLAAKRSLFRRINFDEWTVDLDLLRTHISELLKIAREQGLSRDNGPIKTEDAPAWLINDLYASSKAVIEWLNEFCPEMLNNPNLSSLRYAVNSIRDFISSKSD